jgi:Rrf2 family protein
VIVITEKSRCAVVALTELARRGACGPVPIQDIATTRDIPLHLLEQLFAGLRRAGILQSQRGVKGGYSFARGPAEVSVLEVVETVDGRLGPLSGESADAAGCDGPWIEARTLLVELLGDISIAGMAERDARLRDAPMFHI